MKLRTEVAQIMKDEIGTNAIWRNKLRRGGPVAVSGSVEETIQILSDALLAYSDALFEVTLHLADAVDDLRVKIDK
jgi:hypothetical protein